MTIISVKDKK